MLGSVCGACVGLLEDRGGAFQPWVALITGAPAYLSITLSLSHTHTMHKGRRQSGGLKASLVST